MKRSSRWWLRLHSEAWVEIDSNKVKQRNGSSDERRCRCDWKHGCWQWWWFEGAARVWVDRRWSIDGGKACHNSWRINWWREAHGGGWGFIVKLGLKLIAAKWSRGTTHNVDLRVHNRWTVVQWWSLWCCWWWAIDLWDFKLQELESSIGLSLVMSAMVFIMKWTGSDDWGMKTLWWWWF